MSDHAAGPDWWLASDGKWYPPPKPPPPPPPPAPSVDPVPSASAVSAARKRYVIVAVVVAAATIGIIALANHTDSRSTSVSLPDRTTTHRITYRVEGSARTTNITYSTPGRGTSQQQAVDVPLTRKSDGQPGIQFTFFSGEFLYLSAQNANDSGSITCIIEEDGIELARNSSSGGFVIATCQSQA